MNLKRVECTINCLPDMGCDDMIPVNVSNDHYIAAKFVFVEK